MGIRRSIVAAEVLGICLLLAGCSRQPDAELKAAQAALDDARDSVQADIWAPDEFAAAKESLDAAEQEIEAQNSRFALVRDYSQAKKDLAKAQADAGEARRAALAQRDMAREEANQKAQEASRAIDEAREALDKAPLTKDTRVDIQLFGADLDGLDESLGDVQDLISSQDYKGASVKADTITRSAKEITAKVQAARARVSRRHGR